MLTDSLNQMLNSDDRVAVIKGPWGVGKTHFWNEYIWSKIDKREVGFIAYSYVSLFGKSSLPELRKSIFHGATPLAKDAQIENSIDVQLQQANALVAKLPWLRKAKSKFAWLNKVSKHAENLPFASKYSGLIENIEYSLVDNYLICIDDIERKDSALSMREIMGLVDELVTRKNSKVVLIFNDNSFESSCDIHQYESYREKVVDIELTHNPTIDKNLQLVFDVEDPAYNHVRNACIELDIRNVRVLKKTKKAIERFGSLIPYSCEGIYKPFVEHTTILCWGYFSTEQDLDFDTLCALIEKSWVSSLLKRDQGQSPAEERYHAIASSLKLSPFSMDAHVIKLLRSGLLDQPAVEKEVDRLQSDEKSREVSSALSAVWDLYSDSFSDNLDEFLERLRSIIEREIEFVSVSDFSSAVSMLEEFGCDVVDIIKKYVEVHGESLANSGFSNSLVFSRIKNAELKGRIEAIQNKGKELTIDEIALKIAVQRGWSSEDIEYLCSLGPNDYKDWMKSNPNDLVTKVRSGLLTFRNMQASHDQEKYTAITENVVSALQDIAQENELNRRRVKFLYQVEVGDLM